MVEHDPIHKPQLADDDVMRQEFPNWEQLPEDERGRLVIMYFNELLESDTGALRLLLGLAPGEFLDIPSGIPKDIHETAEYWFEVRAEAEAFWARRYDPNAPEDW